MKQESTSSSPSGRQFGHYHSMLECFRQNNFSIPSLIISIAHISLITASPLNLWQTASQVMLEKGKGRFIENLQIIQLCKADLNFVLHVIWGHHLICHAKKNNSLSTSQYALPGETCNNAVLKKMLFCDLSRQSLSPDVLTDFDATAAFNRVIAGLSIITCERVGLPRIAGKFMFLLLRHMKFHLITGFGKSSSSYRNQGVLQGSSSTAPIFLLNSEISLTAYNKMGIGASFQHPVNGSIVTDHSVQYVDDTSQFLNNKGAMNHIPPEQEITQLNLIQLASQNAQTWANLMWMSGGNLNLGKCFFYAFTPSINYKSNTIHYDKILSDPGISITNPATGTDVTLQSLNPDDSQRTLGVILSPDGKGKLQ